MSVPRGDADRVTLHSRLASQLSACRGEVRRTTSGAGGFASEARIRRRLRPNDLKCQRMIESRESACRNDSRLPLHIGRPSKPRTMVRRISLKRSAKLLCRTRSWARNRRTSPSGNGTPTIWAAEFDEVAAELGRTLDFFKVPEPRRRRFWLHSQHTRARSPRDTPSSRGANHRPGKLLAHYRSAPVREHKPKGWRQRSDACEEAQQLWPGILAGSLVC